jgi:DNA-binding response OmpR family regulator
MRVLLVEDHNNTRTVLARLLTHSGYEVHVAADFASALVVLDQFHFDLLISDIGLPDRTGFQLVAEVKKRQPLKAVAITAWSSESHRLIGLESGFDHYFTKPFDFAGLREVLAEIGCEPESRISRSIRNFCRRFTSGFKKLYRNKNDRTPLLD